MTKSKPVNTENKTELPQGIIVFADGACSGNPGPGGWGAIVIEMTDSGNGSENDSVVTELGGEDNPTTNNKMEMTAIGMGLRFVEEIEGKVTVFTDSSYVINGITKWVKGWAKNGWKKADGGEVANEHFWKRLVEILDRRKERDLGPVEFKYVPGHSGVVGNERCDEIAVEFSKEILPSLFQGTLSEYKEFQGVDIFKGIEKAIDGAPVRSVQAAGKTGAVVYLSYVNGELKHHATWSECEAVVKGMPGAKFKKCKGEDEVEETLRTWGLR